MAIKKSEIAAFIKNAEVKIHFQMGSYPRAKLSMKEKEGYRYLELMADGSPVETEYRKAGASTKFNIEGNVGGWKHLDMKSDVSFSGDYQRDRRHLAEGVFDLMHCAIDEYNLNLLYPECEVSRFVAALAKLRNKDVYPETTVGQNLWSKDDAVSIYEWNQKKREEKAAQQAPVAEEVCA